jgi:hypothetical protein
VQPGKFNIFIGSSSRDIRAVGNFTVQSGGLQLAQNKKKNNISKTNQVHSKKTIQNKTLSA